MKTTIKILLSIALFGFQIDLKAAETTRMFKEFRITLSEPATRAVCAELVICTQINYSSHSGFPNFTAYYNVKYLASRELTDLELCSYDGICSPGSDEDDDKDVRP